MRLAPVSIALLVGCVLAAAPAAALTMASVSVLSFGAKSTAARTNALVAQASFHDGATDLGYESFEGFAGGAVAGSGIDTAVGHFTGAGPGRCGSACTGRSGSTIDTLAIFPAGTVALPSGGTKAVSSGGRYAVDGTRWLDSNDTQGILWTIDQTSGITAFDRLSFMTTDVDDVGSFVFQLKGQSQGLSYALNLADGKTARPDGELLLFMVAFTAAVETEKMSLLVGSTDGMGFDSARISVSAVPLPATAWLLGGAAVALFGLRRRPQA